MNVGAFILHWQGEVLSLVLPNLLPNEGCHARAS
eukprot:COSAG02_NODE_1858_length_10636_cov_6.878333_5_plen_34_part_00